MAADIDQVAVNDAAEVVPGWRENWWQHDPELSHPVSDHLRQSKSTAREPTIFSTNGEGSPAGPVLARTCPGKLHDDLAA